MSTSDNALSRIDPDGSLLADYMLRARRPGANAEDLTALLHALRARGFLRDPDEPKLDVSNLKVLWISQNLTAFPHIAPCEQSLYTAYVRRDDVEKLRANEPTLAEIREKVEGLYTVVDGLGEPRVLRDEVLALLEPRKHDPTATLVAKLRAAIDRKGEHAEAYDDPKHALTVREYWKAKRAAYQEILALIDELLHEERVAR